MEIGLNSKERAYILDVVSNSSFFQDQFGQLSPDEEERLIVSIFQKVSSPTEDFFI
jgi:hypothetical protein